MFTGLIQAVGRVGSLTRRGGDVRLRVETGGSGVLDRLAEGDSVAVSGVCLTALGATRHHFDADVSVETLDCTTLGGLADGDQVNLERALTLATPLGGHLTSGHVDAVTEVLSVAEEARSWRIRFALPSSLARFVSPKGGIALDGVSLTVNDVTESDFGVNIVPHTLEATTMSGYRPGRRVNVEVDMIARYLDRLLEARGLGTASPEEAARS